jgi:DNA polymerase (family 10)
MSDLNSSAVAQLLAEFGQRSALRGGNPYRARAYGRAAESLLALTTPLSDLIAHDRLRDIPGVGAAIADIIRTLHATGSHPALDAMRKEIPEGVLEMLTIPGLRPDKVAKIYKHAGIASIEELERAATEGRLKGVQGTGPGAGAKNLAGPRAAPARSWTPASASGGRPPQGRGRKFTRLAPRVEAHYTSRKLSTRMRTCG